MITIALRRTIRLAALALSLAVVPLTATAQSLLNPDDETIEMLSNFLAGNTPNFREEALNSYDYRSANEFDKPAVLTQIENQLRDQYTRLAEIDGLELRANANIGEYDAAAGVFRISVFKPGSYFPFNRGHALLLDNADAFYEWAIPVAEARQVRELSPSGRVVLDMVLIPFDVAPNNQRHVRGQIVSMRMLEQRSGQLLHEVILPQDQHRSVTSSASAQTERVAQDTLELIGITPGMSLDEAKAQLETQGYHMRENLIFGGIAFSTAQEALETYVYDVEAILNGASSALLNGVPSRDTLEAYHLGPELDCRDDSQLHSCGVLYFNKDKDTVESIAFVQNIAGAAKQDIISSVFDKFGAAGDRFSAYLWKRHAVDQYVWGAFTEDKDLRAHDFTEISGPRRWQVEAYIAEPTTNRKTLIIQITDIPETETSTGGKIKL